ncbi:MAG: HlyC/CorC family transporter [Candidatus Aureabacteria bacterium]|nr:HlyC/CorC family transporter [Candidatus Auribacterota bacterium]
MIAYSIIFLSFILASIAVGSETALNNYPRAKIKSVLERLDKRHVYFNCSSLLYVSLILVRTIGYIIIVSITTVLLFRMDPAVSKYWIFVGIMFFIFTVLIFAGQILPSAIAAKNPEKFISKTFPLIQFYYTIFKPFSSLLVMSGKVIAGTGTRCVYGGFITEEELIDVIDAGEKEGAIEKDEKIMLRSVIEFGDKIVREVMIPRIDLVCLEETSSMEDVMNICETEGFSRIPIYRENVDNIIGILYTRDLLKFWKDQHGKGHSFREILHTPFFVPETKLISDLFREFKKKKIHMAVVVDEYGGTAGVITLEDLIEEIVGEIHDEYDIEEEKPIIKVSDGVFIIQAKTLVDDINKNLDLTLEESDDFDTIGGFIIDKMGKIPRSGEFVRDSLLEFTILEADERSIKKIKIRKLVKEKKEDGK